jgi:hypothetical protein
MDTVQAANDPTGTVTSVSHIPGCKDWNFDLSNGFRGAVANPKLAQQLIRDAANGTAVKIAHGQQNPGQTEPTKCTGSFTVTQKGGATTWTSNRSPNVTLVTGTTGSGRLFDLS